MSDLDQELSSQKRSFVDMSIKAVLVGMADLIAKEQPESNKQEIEKYLESRSPELKKIQADFGILLHKIILEFGLHTVSLDQYYSDSGFEAVAKTRIQSNLLSVVDNKKEIDTYDLNFWVSVADVKAMAELAQLDQKDAVKGWMREMFTTILYQYLLEYGIKTPKALKFFEEKAGMFLEDKLRIEANKDDSFAKIGYEEFVHRVNQQIEQGVHPAIADKIVRTQMDKEKQIENDFKQAVDSIVAKQLPELLKKFSNPEEIIDLILQKPSHDA